MTTKIIIEKTYKCDNKRCKFFAKHLIYLPIRLLINYDFILKNTYIKCSKCKGSGLLYSESKISKATGIFDRNVPVRKNKPEPLIFGKFPANAVIIISPIKPDYFEHTYCRTKADVENKSSCPLCEMEEKQKKDYKSRCRNTGNKAKFEHNKSTY